MYYVLHMYCVGFFSPLSFLNVILLPFYIMARGLQVKTSLLANSGFFNHMFYEIALSLFK